MECLLDGPHDLPDGVHDVPQPLHQVLPARYLSDGLGICRKVQRSILNSLVQLHELVVGLLDGVLVVPLYIQLLVAQGQQFLGAGAGFVQCLPQSIGAHAVFLQCRAKTACFLDLFLGHSAGRQRHLLQCVGVGVALVAHLVRQQLVPPAVQSLGQPLAQVIDAGHEDVVQPVRQLSPRVGGLFLVAEDGLEDRHPF